METASELPRLRPSLGYLELSLCPTPLLCKMLDVHLEREGDRQEEEGRR